MLLIRSYWTIHGAETNGKRASPSHGISTGSRHRQLKSALQKMDHDFCNEEMEIHLKPPDPLHQPTDSAHWAGRE